MIPFVMGFDTMGSAVPYPLGNITGRPPVLAHVSIDFHRFSSAKKGRESILSRYEIQGLASPSPLPGSIC